MDAREVHEIRVALGHSLASFADAVSVSRGLVTDWESGRRKVSETHEARIRTVFCDELKQVRDEEIQATMGFAGWGREWEAPDRGTATATGRVYFAQAGYRMKIGWSANVARRLRHLEKQVEPLPIVCVGSVPGTRSDESAFHYRFAELRDCGEWFHLREPLVRFCCIRGWTLDERFPVP